MLDVRPGRPITRNSALDGLRVTQLDDNQDEIRETVDCRSEMASEEFLR